MSDTIDRCVDAYFWLYTLYPDHSWLRARRIHMTLKFSSKRHDAVNMYHPGAEIEAERTVH